GIYETHLSVKDRKLSRSFYREVLGLVVAKEIEERDVTFFWINDSLTGMLGIWGEQASPPVVSGKGHFAFSVSYEEIVRSIGNLKSIGITPLGINEEPIEEPIVISWMPAISVYFKDPDDHSLELIHVL